MEQGKDIPARYFQHAFDHAPFGVAIVDGENNWVYVNEALAQSFGYALAEWPEDRTWWDHTVDADRDGDQAAVDACKEQGGPPGYTMEKRYHRKNPGQWFWAELTVSVIRDIDQNFEMFVSYIVPTDRPAISASMFNLFIANWKQVTVASVVVFILLAWGFGLISTEKAQELFKIIF